SDCPIFTFEHGADNWSKQGIAFVHQPIFGGHLDHSPSRSGHHGNWLVDSSSNVTTPCRWQNASLGDGATGTMTSPPFVIRSSYLSFLIGGGCDDKKVRMEILVNGSTIISRTGSCQSQMKRTGVNLDRYKGRTAKVKLIDYGVGNWGHITFDDLRHGVPCEDLMPCSNPICQTPDIRQESYYNCSCGKSLPNIQSCYSNDTCIIPHGSCKSFCNDTETSCQCRQCTCDSGHSFNRHNQSCDDINECQSGAHDCQHTCVNTDGGYRCSCLSGYQLNSDQKSCSDRDECSDNKGGCDHVCVNSAGSYYCLCNQGWSISPADKLACIDKDECSLNPYLCSDECVNTPGSYYCSCRSGYTLSPDKSSCDDIDECLTNNGGCQFHCKNTPGSFQCLCEPGYQIGSDGRTCIDVDECSNSRSPCLQVCVNTLGSYYCSCQFGYQLQSDNTTCIDVNECQLHLHNCSQLCNNFPGGYNCSCSTGYQLSADSTTCSDVDECLHENAGCPQLCVNTIGSFDCSCFRGYKLDIDNSTCVDVDECERNLDNCSHLCNNFDGSYNCSCFSGYQLSVDGKNCSDVDECSQDNEGCSQICVNTPGNYNCSCFQGYQMKFDDDRYLCNESCKSNNSCPRHCTDCEDVNECEDADPCEQECENTNGSYICSCYVGFTLKGDRRTCSDVDECELSSNMGCTSCVNRPGDFQCTCAMGYTFNKDNMICEEKKPLEVTLTEGQRKILEAPDVAAIVETTNHILKEVNVSKTMSSEALTKTLGVLSNLTEKIQYFNTSQEEAKELITTVTVMFSLLMTKERESSWRKLKEEEGTAPINVITNILEKAVTAVVSSVDKETDSGELNVIVSTENLDMQVKSKNRQAYTGSKIPADSPNFVNLPGSVVQDRDDNDTVGISVALLKGVKNILSNDTVGESSSDNRLNSIIFVVTVINVSPRHLAKLNEPVVLRFQHLRKDGQQHTCSFLNETAIAKFPKDYSKHWSSVGCKKVKSTDEFTICHCSHLTSYGLIMDVHNIYDKLDEDHKETLKYISLVGCCVSIFFCLLAALGFSFAMMKPRETKARRDTYYLHINLVLAICFSQICFVIGTFIVTVDVLACRIISIATHYFLSASFCWMLAEGIHIYNKIVRVFSNKKYNKVFFVLGWGAPIISVMVSSGIAFHHYGPHNICWLSGKLIWAFAAPVLFVMLVNCFILISVIYVLLTKTMVKAGEENSTKKSNTRRSIKVTVVLLPLLGLTWVFGFMAVDENTIFFHYIFATINSLQGIFIFVAHCWTNDSVREILLEKMPSFNIKGKYNIGKKRKQSNARNSSTSLETATTSTTSVRLVTINKSPTGPRRLYEQPPMKLVNVEQEMAIGREEPYDERSVRLVNLAKLPSKYADVFDIPAAKLFSVNKPPPIRRQDNFTSLSSVNLVTPDDLPITPKEAYDNPTYAFWYQNNAR
ncbi:unnamed protein product, partial [Porites lobata]